LILLSIPGKPVPYKAPSFGSNRTFNPRYAEKQATQFHIKQQYDTSFLPILSSPIAIDIIFYFEIPKSFSKRKVMQALNGEIFPSMRPDIDNLSKFLHDCLIDTVITDDSLIVDLTSKKRYSTKAHTVIQIREINKELGHEEDGSKERERSL
jgi:Holliday junction resolvase RusA-like endonuclease